MFAHAQLDANSVMGIPTATTIAEMNAIVGAATGSLVYNLEDSKAYLFNGTIWVSASNDGWSVDGNIGLANTNFLGHRDDVAMEIRSDNLPLLQFGRRGTLGLVQNIVDYTDSTQPLVHVNGDGVTSAIQFTASAATSFKPMFFTTTDGNFRLKGSAAGTDFFEIGSTGTVNNGSMEFIIGDDGLEPFIFKRVHFSDQSTQELMRIQGSVNSANSADPKTRVGINTSALANSTLQISGSLSKSTERTSGPLTLTEDHYSIIIDDASHFITLPLAAGLKGREYVIKNTNTTDVMISNYRNRIDRSVATIPAENILKIQSDGVFWNQMNNYAELSTSTGGGIITGTITPTGTLDNTGHLNLNFFEDNNNFLLFVGNFSGQGPADFEVLLSNVPYSTIVLTGAGGHVLTGTNDNGNGTFTHLITSGTTSVAGQPQVEITGNPTSPLGFSSGPAATSPVAPTTITFFIL